ncbi:MAG: hypothetical protein D6737_09875, partial [Chloroflexi bacterium]
MLQRVLAHKLALIVAVSVAVRLAILLAFPSIFAFEDTGAIHGSDAYDRYATNLLDTGVYGLEPGVPDAQIPPLYSYALAGVYGLFGRGHLQVGLFHILLDALSIAFLFHIGKRLMPYGEWVGALAGLFYALYPYLVFQNLTLIDTPFFMTGMYAFILVMILLREREALDRKTWGLAILGGLILGASTLTRPILAPFAVLVAVWFIFKLSLRQTVLRLAPVALIGALLLVPWIVRNYHVFDAFVPMTTTSGANFWQGNSEFTVRYFRAGYDVQWTAPLLPTGFDRTSREADAERFRLAFEFLANNPDKIPELLWTKFLVYWSIDVTPRLNPVDGELPRLDYEGNPIVEEGDDGSLSLTGLPDNDPVLAYSQPLFDRIGRMVHRFYFGGLFLLGIVGVGLTWRERKSVSLLWFVQLAMTIVYLTFHPATRYRAPTDPLLFVFS